jgi:hypothetical protein
MPQSVSRLGFLEWTGTRAVGQARSSVATMGNSIIVISQKVL